MAITVLAALVFGIWLVGGIQVAVGSRRIPYLRDQPARAPDGTSVSIVVAARNEAATLGAGLRSLALQQAIEFEILVVDDRSEDGTGAVAEKVAVNNHRVSVVRVDQLPEGWLGKTHALERGAEAASGDWLLFTDADIVMEPEAVARAVGYAERSGTDHVAVTPELRMPTLPADAFGAAFVLLFSRYTRPWRASDPASREYIGIGAFNLVRREAHRAIGGHASVRLRPDDDLMLGKAIKRAGYRQALLYGTGQIRVAWYSSLGEAIRGLEKNSFAGMEYSVIRVIASCLALLLTMTWPWIAMLTTDGVAQGLSIATCILMSGIYVASSWTSGTRPWLAPFLPLSAVVICYAVLRSTALAIRNGGIRWRDTVYDLELLRSFRV